MTLNPTTKKIIYVALFLGAVVAIAYLIYVVFFRQPSEDVIVSNVNDINVGLPNINDLLENANVIANENIAITNVGIPGVDEVARGNLTATQVLTPDVETQDPSISNNGEMRFYDPEDGMFYKIQPDGSVATISDAKFKGVDTVTWADTTNETVLEFPDGSNVYYDLDSGRQVTLPKEYEEFDFSPTSNQIAFKYMHIDPERRVLAVSSPDGASARTLVSLGNNAHRVDVNWSPTGKVAATWAEFIDFNRQELGFIGLKGENFKGTIVEGKGLKSQYTSDGKQLLYSVYSSATDHMDSLWIVDADGNDIGKNRRELNLYTTADKCTISSDSTTAYCGVPSQSKAGSGLEPRILDDVTDDIYKINLKNGSKSKVATPVDSSGNPAYSIDEIVLSADDSKLYFRDSKSGQLIKLNLE